MQHVEMTLLRLIQLLVTLFFTFIVLVYIGGVVIIPLAVLMTIINFLDHGIGFNGIIAAIVAVPAVVWIGLTVYRIPNLVLTLLDTGTSLIKLGAKNFRQFDSIAHKIKNPEQSIETSATQ